jgi:hypothetical protein
LHGGLIAMMGSGGPRRSGVVTLTVLGLVSTVFIADEAFPHGVAMRRNLYADRAACERDYPPSECEPTQPTGGTGRGWGYRGPYYSANRASPPAGDPGPGRSGVAPASFESSVRGGFGGFGRGAHGVS